MLKAFETEVVEFKEANNSYSFKDIGEYFSTFENEANIRGKNEAWLVLGITNKGELKGTDYRKSGNPQSLKKFLNLLQKMKTEGIVGVCGRAVHAEWFLVKIM